MDSCSTPKTTSKTVSCLFKRCLSEKNWEVDLYVRESKSIKSCSENLFYYHLLIHAKRTPSYIQNHYYSPKGSEIFAIVEKTGPIYIPYILNIHTGPKSSGSMSKLNKNKHAVQCSSKPLLSRVIKFGEYKAKTQGYVPKIIFKVPSVVSKLLAQR